MDKVKFKTEYNGSEVELETISVTPKIQRESEKFANLAFQDAINMGLMLHIQMEQTIRNSNYDLDKDIEKIESINKRIRELERGMLSGYDGVTKLDKFARRSMAIEIAKSRGKIDDIVNTTSNLYSRTAEKYSENERYLYFIYACTLDPKTGKPFFKSFEDFKENNDSKMALDATRNFFKMYSNDRQDANKVEIKWLIKNKFMTDKFQFIDSEGNLCDEDFRRINDKGRYLDDKGREIDRFGNLIDENGEIIVPDEVVE